MWDHRWGDLRMGPIQFIILLQLKRSPMYGYEIIKSLRSQFEGVWEPKTGTIYPALRSLENRELVRTEMKDDREYYSLTQEGERILRGLDEVVGAGVERAGRYYSFLEGFPEMRKFWKRYVYEPSRYWIPRFKDYEKDLELKSLKSIRDAMKSRLEYIEKRIGVLEAMQPATQGQ